MMGYVDLNLRPPIEDIDQTKAMLKKASQLGYSHIAIPLSPNVTNQLIGQLKQICNEVKADFVTRVNFSPRNSKELLHDLQRFRRKFEIVAVRCNTKDVARQAAKDRRVDLLHFSVANLRQRFFDQSEAELASQALSSLEIELAPILQLETLSRVRLLSFLRKEIAIAQRAKVPITLSSGATVSSLMRSPRDYAALTVMLDLPLPSALKALSQNPLEMVERNRKKLNTSYVAPGIHFVGRKSV
jgi:RNase P/RNase MRP subunit p30